jgi:hypothetical protein
MVFLFRSNDRRISARARRNEVRMMETTCACGAVGRFVTRGHHDGPARVSLEWRGGRIGVGKLAIEGARSGVTTCPACQHRRAVFMLSRDSSAPAEHA